MIDYPLTLPVPRSIQLTPQKRSQNSDDAAPRESRALSVDRIAEAQVSWVLTPEQTATLRAFWKDDLVYGGAWFNAEWPHPEGLVVKQYRFISAPSKALTDSDHWTVSANVEIRGRGEPVSDVGTGFPTQNDPWSSEFFVGSVTFAEADFFATTTTNGGVRDVLGHLSFSVYGEIEVGPFSFYEGGAVKVQFGMGTDAGQMDVAYHDMNGDISAEGGEPFPGTPLNEGDVIMCAFDGATGNYWLGLNGVWFNDGDPATGANPLGTLALVSAYVFLGFFVDNSELGYSARVRTASGTFNYPIPTGFLPWNAAGD